MKVFFATIVVAFCSIAAATMVRAADHGDPPDRAGDAAADIADLYVWHDSGSGNVTVVLTFDGNKTPVAGQTGTYDADVLYGLHFSNTGSAGTPPYSSTLDTYVRFGDDGNGNWGVQLVNFPGETAPVQAAVNTVGTTPSGGKFFAGLRDDPFFFDLEGFETTLNTGTLSFDSTRDSFAGNNATALVLEFPATAVANGAGMFHAWATTARIGGTP